MRTSRPMPYLAESSRVKNGESTDIYFQRTRAVLEQAQSFDVNVVAEVHSYSFPDQVSYAVLTGLEEVAWLLEGLPVNVYAVEEGTLFTEREPVLSIEGRYRDFAVYEPSILGFLRHATSITTKAARVKRAAEDKPVLFFGIRCVHPAITPMVDRAAYVGGCDAVSGVVGAEMLGLKPTGTMPHALILAVGEQAKAWLLFHRLNPPEVPRIALVDTFSDERFEALLAAETLGKDLYGVRLDTPSSRRGSIKKIAEEVRWALDINGYRHVKIFVSGGLDEHEIEELKDLVDGFGVGTSIAFPPSIDLALDIVEREGKPFSKRGKLPGRKQVYRCSNYHDYVVLWGSKLERCPKCSAGLKPLLTPLILKGEVVRRFPDAADVRSYVLK
ncbi:MAG: nicotinate phosphoribosyltransferase, partial [Candidatus Caldarchaeum sp.]|nr:nicotinate phosphoribosyltransferase [Candidatus Caldarchaeum sp.]